MRFEFKSRFTAEVIYTQEIPDGTEEILQCKLALELAVKNGADLSGAYLSGANLSDANLRGADLSDADLSGAYLRGADLSGANLRGADLSDADLSGADLSDANLSDANLSDAYLRGANLSDANLSDAYLRGANLSDANLSGADLSDADLSGAYLRGANLAQFKQDFIAEVLKLPNELEALRSTIVAGKIDGSTYSGDCACLAGTLAKAYYKDDLEDDYDGSDIQINGICYVADASSPREQWFMQIKPGDTPETNQAAKIALEWLDEAIMMRDHIRKAA